MATVTSATAVVQVPSLPGPGTLLHAVGMTKKKKKRKEKKRKKRKINKTKSLFFERANKIDKSLARLTKKRGNPNKQNKNESGEIANNTQKLKKTLKEYYEQFTCQQTAQPRRMDKFLET